MTEVEEIQQLKQKVAAMERELAELKSERPRERMGNPWARVIGAFANNPEFDAWQEEIAQYRKERDAHELDSGIAASA